MKKIAKSSVLMLIMLSILCMLTGCGGDKLVATMKQNDLEQTVEIKFKDDVASEIKMTINCESNDDAKEGKEFFEEEMKDAKVKQSGKKVIVTMDMKTFAEEYGIDYENNKEELNKEKLTEMLENAGYEVK